jgi:hypothetical protein
VALIECEPRINEEVVQVATLDELRATAEQFGIAVAEPPEGVSVKAMEPERATDPAGVGVTVAVKVTGALIVEGLPVVVRATVVVPTWTVCVKVLLLVL